MQVLNDLYDYENFKIYQEEEGFKFSLDSILLAEFVSVRDKNQKILDLCTGNAVIPLLLSYYFSNSIVGFEIQKVVCDLALQSVIKNKKEMQIKIINDDVKTVENYFPGNNFDIIVANPPYFKYEESSFINKGDRKAIARHEIYLDLEEIFKVVSYALKDYGEFYLVHLPSRLEEIFYFCEKYKIRAKEMCLVTTKKESNPKMVLIKCVKNGHNQLKVRTLENIQEYSSYKNIFRK